jgi:DNA-binding FadR family transcriptional regulator
MQLKGSVVMGQESVSSRMYHIARQELQLGHVRPIERQLDQMLAVTRDEVVEALRHAHASRSLLARGPRAARGPERSRPADRPVAAEA